MSTFDANQLARAWLSVALASVKDSDRPALDRTISVELYPEGARLAATDSYVLLAAWVPDLDHEFAADPGADEAPTSATVVMDIHGRARGFFAHLLTLTGDDDTDPIQVTLRSGIHGELGDGNSFEGLEALFATLEYPGHEKLTLQCYEGDYPNWRKIGAQHTPKSTKQIALNPEILGRLGKLAKLNPGCPLLWNFGGVNKMAVLEVGDSDPFVYGLVMPMRWDFDKDEPAGQEQPAPES